MLEEAPSLFILVVDDEPGLADAIAGSLRDEGHRVATASDGEEALDLASAIPVHLVLSDLLMPRLPGDDLLRALRERDRPAFWFAIMTSMPEALVAQRIGGYQRYLAKPLDLARVRALVADCAASPEIAARLRADARGGAAA